MRIDPLETTLTVEIQFTCPGKTCPRARCKWSFCKSEIIRRKYSPDFWIIFSIVATMAISSHGASVNWLDKQKRAKAIYNKHFRIRCLC